MRKTLHIAAVLIVIVVGGLGVMRSVEDPASNFKDYTDMADSGLIDAGWIPDYLPRSAFDIDATHNLESNIVKINFRFKLGDTGIARRRCTSATSTGQGILLTCEEGSLQLSNDGQGYFTNAPDDA